MDWKEQILNYDITPILEKVQPHKYARHQSIPMELLFPTIPGLCACGCGTLLKGRQRKWASKECQRIPAIVHDILCGRTAVLYKILVHRDGEKCSVCGRGAEELFEIRLSLEGKRFVNNPLEVDHVVPVHKGGGGCWLDNYQLICWIDHKEKTRKDVSRSL